MRKICYLLFALLLASCAASTYKPSQETQILRDSMDRSSALAIAADMLQKKPGLCDALSNRQQVSPVIFQKLFDDVIQYRVDMVISTDVTGISILQLPTAKHGGLISVEIRENHQYETYGMTLSKLTKIRIQNEHNVCRLVQGGFVVSIDTDEQSPNAFGSQHLAIAVNNTSDLNSLVAALMYLSPQARVIEGMGF